MVDSIIIKIALFIIVPYLVGVALSSIFLPAHESTSSITSPSSTPSSTSESPPIPIPPPPTTSSLNGLSFSIHRNGEATSCGDTQTDNLETILLSLMNNKKSLSNLDISKYKVDKLLTEAFGKHLLSMSDCGPEKPPKSIKGHRRVNWGRGTNYKIDGVNSSFLTFCDMGPDRTPILHDHDKLRKVSSGNGVSTLPCHFHTREGLRITSFDQLIELTNTVVNTDDNSEYSQQCSVNSNGEQTCVPSNHNNYRNNRIMHLYAVPAGRLFMFAPSYVGEVFTLSHVDHPANPNPVTLKVLSVSPRVFDVVNFFEEDESQAIVDKALAETSESHRIKRSSTGATGYNVNSQRTSENGFDTHGATAIAVKKRTLEMVGFDEYIESYTDGLQVLRYNKTTAYIPHMDWIDDPGKRQHHDFDSAKLGTNRFATVLLYMTNLKEGDGGETVFKHGFPHDVSVEERRETADVLRELRQNGEVSFLTEGSWEEKMVADCRSRLAIRPHAGRAVLFYSQHPNGEEDTSSLHGGCPVLSGVKWAANNWIWNGPRGGFPGSPVNKKFKGTEEEKNPPGQLKGFFRNTGKDTKFADAKLYFQDQEWGDFSFGNSHSVNTFHGHQWNVKDSKGNILKTWTVAAEPKSQIFEV